ncbi:MAG: sigma-70 family RNA polymerase sigma factor [Candidatus Magasanikbacteria bacterium]|nr:sigma-70 family RNA polymerase sigma factor [Candidatus Magasanikbacteria bacterium]
MSTDWQDLQWYLARFRQYPPLTDEQEFRQLFSYWQQTADQETYHRLVYGNIRLTLSVAFKYRGYGLPLLDLVQEGVVGIEEALHRFEPRQGFRFSTYAVWYIRHHIQRAIENGGSQLPYRIPVYLHEQIRYVRRARFSFFQFYGQWPEEEQLFQFIHRVDGTAEGKVIVGKLSRKVLRRCLSFLSRYHHSFDQETGSSEESGRLLSELIPDPSASPEQEIMARELLAEYQQQLDTLRVAIARVLNEHELTILRGRLGWGLPKPLTLQQIGDQLDVSRERIRQLEVEIFLKLRRAVAMTPAEIERLLLAIEHLKALAGEEGEDDAVGKAGEESGGSDDVSSYEDVFRLLCEHLLLTPTGHRIIKAPLQVLQIRCGLSLAQARRALVELQQRQLIAGAEPWLTIRVIPAVPIPTFGARPEKPAQRPPPVRPRAADREPLLPKEAEFAGAGTAALPPTTAAIEPSALSIKEKPPIHGNRHVRQAPATAESAYLTLAKWAVKVGGQQVVRGPVLVMQVDFSAISIVEIIALLQELLQLQWIKQLDGWRAVILQRGEAAEAAGAVAAPVEVASARREAFPAPVPVVEMAPEAGVDIPPRCADITPAVTEPAPAEAVTRPEVSRASVPSSLNPPKRQPPKRRRKPKQKRRIKKIPARQTKRAAVTPSPGQRAVSQSFAAIVAALVQEVLVLLGKARLADFLPPPPERREPKKQKRRQHRLTKK